MQFSEEEEEEADRRSRGLGFQLPAEGDERCAAAHRSVCDPCRFVVI